MEDIEIRDRECQISKSKCQRNVKVQSMIPKRFENDILIIPNPADGGTFHLSFGFDLALIHLWFITSCELCHLTFRVF